LLAALVALAVASAAWADAPATTTPQQRAARLAAELEGAACAARYSAAHALLRSRNFMLLAQPERERFALALASCAFELAHYGWADEAAQRAGGAGAALRPLTKLALMIWEEENDEALAELAKLARSSPPLVRRLAASAVDDLRSDLAGEDALALFDALVAAGWRAERPEQDARLRLAHARLLVERGRVQEARERLHEPLPAASVIAIRSDRRLDALREDPAFAQRCDVAVAAQRDLARARTEVAERPRSLEATVRLTAALRALARTDEAIAEAERALALDEATEGAHYDDDEAQRSSLLRALADALFETNRAEDAYAALQRAASHGEEDGTNSGALLALALALSDEERGADALAVLDEIEEPSSDERLWMEAIRVCASVQLGDFRQRRSSLEKLESDGERSAARARALLCMGDLDGAAGLYSARLLDPFAREAALRVLQHYANRPEPALPQRDVIRARLRAVAERPDVAETVQQLGRIEQLPIAATDAWDL
jgi:hypothetical protein